MEEVFEQADGRMRRNTYTCRKRSKISKVYVNDDKGEVDAEGRKYRKGMNGRGGTFGNGENKRGRERERDEYEEDDICVGAIKMSWESDVFGNGEN